MATIIWCDHIKHVVTDSRSEVAEVIDRVRESLDSPNPERAAGMHPRGFAYFEIAEQQGIGGGQRALNVSLISSFEAAPGDPV